MQTQEIVHACGHVQAHSVTHINDEQTGRLEARLCRPCFFKRLSQDAARTNKRLPQLKGSLKQIARAEGIRTKANRSLSKISHKFKVNV